MVKKTRLRIWTIFSPTDVRVLRQPSNPVDVATIHNSEFQRLIADMMITMKQAEGIGLAAPQVGRNIRLTVIAKLVDESLTEPLVLINPTLVSPSPDSLPGEEGCLSIPGVFGIVHRAGSITVRYFDSAGQAISLRSSGLLARVIQHEVDHLNGRLFIDRQPQITRGQELLP